MLRHARSLPTLRVLDSAISKEAKQFSTASTKYNLAVPNIPHNEHRPFTRNVHQTSKKNSLLVTSKQSEFAIMSLNTLKMECRKRGLKVSGRKTELVSRIQNYESSFSTNVNSISTSTKSKRNSELKKILDTKKPFSSTTKALKKDDDSHIDYIKPIDPIEPKLVDDDYIVQIPSISTKASKTPVTKLEKKLLEEQNIYEKIISVAEGSFSKVAESGSSEEHHEEEAPEEPYEFDHSKISKDDKKFWAGVLAVTGAWWLFKPKDKK